MGTVRGLILSLIIAAVPLLALAADVPPPAEPVGVGAYVKMLAILAGMVGLLYLLYAASRRGFGGLPGMKNGRITLVETRPLGGRKFLCLVQVRGQELLLGVSPERIERLHVFDEVPPEASPTLRSPQEPS